MHSFTVHSLTLCLSLLFFFFLRVCATGGEPEHVQHHEAVAAGVHRPDRGVRAELHHRLAGVHQRLRLLQLRRARPRFVFCVFAFVLLFALCFCVFEFCVFGLFWCLVVDVFDGVGVLQCNSRGSTSTMCGVPLLSLSLSAVIFFAVLLTRVCVFAASRAARTRCATTSAW